MSEIESKHYLADGSQTLPDAREALEWAAETRVSMVDLKFCDLLGTWQHLTLPLRALDASAFDWSAVPARVTIHIRPASTHLVLPIRRCPDRGRIVLPLCDEQVGAG